MFRFLLLFVCVLSSCTRCVDENRSLITSNADGTVEIPFEVFNKIKRNDMDRIAYDTFKALVPTEKEYVVIQLPAEKRAQAYMFATADSSIRDNNPMILLFVLSGPIDEENLSDALVKELFNMCGNRWEENVIEKKDNDVIVSFKMSTYHRHFHVISRSTFNEEKIMLIMYTDKQMPTAEKKDALVQEMKKIALKPKIFI